MTTDGHSAEPYDAQEERGRQRSGWISVEESSPEVDRAVLVATWGGKIVTIDALCQNGQWLKSQQKNVTHWMPLPEPPM